MNNIKTKYTTTSDRQQAAPQYRGNSSYSSYSYSQQSAQRQGSKYQAPRRAGDTSYQGYQAGYLEYPDETYQQTRGAYNAPSTSSRGAGGSSYRGGAKSSYNQQRRPNQAQSQYYEGNAGSSSSYPKYKQDDYYGETAADYHGAYGEEEIEQYYGETPSSSYYSKGTKYAGANSSRAGGNEAAPGDSAAYFESENYNGGNSRQYQDSKSYSQHAKNAYPSTNQKRSSQAKYTPGGGDDQRSYGKTGTSRRPGHDQSRAPHKRTDGYQESGANYPGRGNGNRYRGTNGASNKAQPDAYDTSSYPENDKQYYNEQEHQYYYEQYYPENTTSEFKDEQYAQQDTPSYEDGNPVDDDQIYRYRRKKNAYDQYTEHASKDTNKVQEILPSQMIIVVNNKDKDGQHDHEEEEEDVEGQKMPSQPHRKVIIKANDNHQNEPEGGGDRRESSSSWASCEDTPAESQLSHESSLYDSTPNRNGPKVQQYQAKKQQPLPAGQSFPKGMVGDDQIRKDYQTAKYGQSKQGSEAANSPQLRHQTSSSRQQYPGDGDDSLEKDALIYQLPEVEFKMLDPNMNNSQSTPAVPDLTSQGSNQQYQAAIFQKQYKHQIQLDSLGGNGSGPITSNNTTLQIRSVQNLNVVTAPLMAEKAGYIEHQQWLQQSQQVHAPYLRQVQQHQPGKQPSNEMSSMRTVHYQSPHQHDYPQKHIPVQSVSPFHGGDPVDDPTIQYGYYQNNQSPSRKQDFSSHGNRSAYTVTAGARRGGGHSQMMPMRSPETPQTNNPQMYYIQQQQQKQTTQFEESGYSQAPILQDEYYPDNTQQNDFSTSQLNLEASQFFPTSTMGSQRPQHHSHISQHSLGPGSTADLSSQQNLSGSGPYQQQPQQQQLHLHQQSSTTQPTYGASQISFNMLAKEFVPSYKKQMGGYPGQDRFNTAPPALDGNIPVTMSEHYMQNFQNHELSPQELKYMQLLQSQQQQQRQLIQQQLHYQQIHQQQNQRTLGNLSPSQQQQFLDPDTVAYAQQTAQEQYQNQQQLQQQQMYYEQQQQQYYIQQQQQANGFYPQQLQQYYQIDPRTAGYEGNEAEFANGTGQMNEKQVDQESLKQDQSHQQQM